jgi:uncharacterized protein YndB with AHSA1/START domain
MSEKAVVKDWVMEFMQEKFDYFDYPYVFLHILKQIIKICLKMPLIHEEDSKNKSLISKIFALENNHKYRLGHPVWWAILAGAIAGLVLRFFFNMPAGKSFSAMQGSFIYGAPILSAAISTWLSGPKRRLKVISCMAIGGLSACLVVVGALLILIEGWICAIIIFPIFLLLGMATGLVMWILYSVVNEIRARRAVYSFAVLPLIFGAIEHQVAPPPYEFHETVQTVFIKANPEIVWKHVTQTKPIESKFFERSFSSMIGVPAPVEANTELLSNGKWVRHMKWEKDVHFYGDVTEFQPSRKLAWKYRFEENSFPKGALDDHVTLSGEHFELIDGSYLLTAKDGGTYLTETTHWRVSTQFNIYSRFLGNVLISDTVSRLINMMKVRSETEG